MSWRLGNEDSEGWSHQTFDEVPSMSCCVRFPQNDVCVHLRFALLDGHIADERQDFDLLVDRYLAVLFRWPVEVRHHCVQERSNGGEVTRSELVLDGKRRQRRGSFVAGT